jgi:hypothetical protein
MPLWCHKTIHGKLPCMRLSLRVHNSLKAGHFTLNSVYSFYSLSGILELWNFYDKISSRNFIYSCFMTGGLSASHYINSRMVGWLITNELEGRRNNKVEAVLKNNITEVEWKATGKPRKPLVKIASHRCDIWPRENTRTHTRQERQLLDKDDRYNLQSFDSYLMQRFISKLGWLHSVNSLNRTVSFFQP